MFIVSLGLLVVSTFLLFNQFIQELISFGNANVSLEYTLTNIIFRLTLLGVVSVLVKESLKVLI